MFLPEVVSGSLSGGDRLQTHRFPDDFGRCHHTRLPSLLPDVKAIHPERRGEATRNRTQPCRCTLACMKQSTGGKILPQLSAHGGHITDPDGNVVVLRGFNLCSKTAQTPEQLGFGSNNASVLKEWGVSVVRLGVPWANTSRICCTRPMARTRCSTTCSSWPASSEPSPFWLNTTSTRWWTSTRTHTPPRGDLARLPGP